ncbi:MAG: SRPBCC family protein [Acidimicrobiales bacterium]
MPVEPAVFETEVTIAAPPEHVFRHLVDPTFMVRWMGQHAVLEAEPGGRFEIDVNGVPVRGQYLEVDPPRRVLVTWGMAGNDSLPPGATEVEFTLSPAEDGGSTTLHLVHRNLPEAQRPMHKTGWDHFLARLGVAATEGDAGPDPWGTRPP